MDLVGLEDPFAVPDPTESVQASPCRGDSQPSFVAGSGAGAAATAREEDRRAKERAKQGKDVSSSIQSATAIDEEACEDERFNELEDELEY